MRTYTDNADKTLVPRFDNFRSTIDFSSSYYITAAPQCPFPDAYTGPAINQSRFDAVYVQFYNNYCSVTNYADPNSWNYAAWDDWAQNKAPNKDVKIYLGAAASSTAAHTGYAPISLLTTIIQQTRAQYSSFGGVMFWDASQAYSERNPPWRPSPPTY